MILAVKWGGQLVRVGNSYVKYVIHMLPKTDKRLFSVDYVFIPDNKNSRPIDKGTANHSTDTTSDSKNKRH